MQDGLLGRVKRLVAGSVNSLVDQVEAAAPEAVLKEAIREIEGALDDVRHELGKTVADKHHAAKRLSATSDQHGELGEKIDFAVNEGRDDLAEAAIAKQLDLEAQIPVLERALTDFSEEEKELEGYIAALSARKREMESDLEQFLRLQKETQAVKVTEAGTPAPDDRARSAERAFDRVLRNATGIGSVTTDRDTARKLEELSQIERSSRIQERLAKIKAVQKGQ